MTKSIEQHAADLKTWLIERELVVEIVNDDEGASELLLNKANVQESIVVMNLYCDKIGLGYE